MSPILFKLIEYYYSNGIRYFHLFNTIYSEKGGISGIPLKEFTYKNIKKINIKKYKDIKIIAGGGVYSNLDIQKYLSLNVNSVSISTVFFYPFRLILILIKQIKKNIKQPM